MPYKLIEGEVRLFYRSTRLVGSRPDGDSTWFKPDNPNLLSDIGHRSADFNKGGFAQLRFEGIDASKASMRWSCTIPVVIIS
jgi:hypothetical protein